MFKLKRGDILLITVLILVGTLWLGLRYYNEKTQVYDPSSLSAVITVDGNLYEKIPLDGREQNIEIKTEYGHNILKVFDNGIQMVYADCPKKISMAMGFISRPNESIVCVPNRIFVEVVKNQSNVTDTDDGIDAYVR
ncbi:NusG domain II-containing protein [Paenibacillus segetis]|uniref:Lipoprotein n=1 Tax=Paenibacillus segetis TaxID=1325360 RepID=A0ABQ1Y5N1_9BACL|nr:NusG domain II-containing protein [Paenibacillus segetis]GGH13570.1 lipoprotein [Paenibacillus segetis]